MAGKAKKKPAPKRAAKKPEPAGPIDLVDWETTRKLNADHAKCLARPREAIKDGALVPESGYVAHELAYVFETEGNPVDALESARFSIHAGLPLCNPVRGWLVKGISDWRRLEGNVSLDVLLGLKVTGGGHSPLAQKETGYQHVTASARIAEFLKQGLTVENAIIEAAKQPHDGVTYAEDSLRRIYKSNRELIEWFRKVNP